MKDTVKLSELFNVLNLVKALRETSGEASPWDHLFDAEAIIAKRYGLFLDFQFFEGGHLDSAPGAVFVEGASLAEWDLEAKCFRCAYVQDWEIRCGHGKSIR